ncbi:RnfABCDGE type electron transport complex subunit G [Ruminococcus gauvreauii]|uniref:Ion-translocating oxidoreductase complex subunit G n=1 Tax=Ruminococcus gauvreauii TaxID=438033 RepID=A0ABY5VHC9_9FIRM|nr:RnfABCDGE type electron transport complex subunit G [Ruminococcus gauvreauii]UWP59692.1 RnfABCDGE type electron transport complex subunit G [Ruminococcus gauvreauii]
MGKIIKDAGALLAITLVAGFLLGLVYDVTLEPIQVQEELAKKEACQEVFADAADFRESDADLDAVTASNIENGWDKQTIDEVMEAVNESGEIIGYVITVTDSEGYGGDITFSMGVQMDGMLNGISILSISETAGLGMKADTDEFKNQFKGKNVEKFEYTKTGAASDEQIDALSGATITTNAVTNGVNAGLAAFQYLKGGN